jgi:hypothetical protein
MSWAAKYGFESNPYQRLDPYKIDVSKLAWNRSDLEEQREKIDQFIDDLSSQQKAGMRVIGSFGSGKTWFARIIEIELQGKLGDKVFSIYTKVPKIEPTFSNVYGIAVKDFLDQIDCLKKIVTERGGSFDLEGWSSVFKDDDLAKGLTHICGGGKSGLIAQRWLEGNRVTSAELSSLDVVDSITSDYRRLEVLVNLLKYTSDNLTCVALIVDELENAPLRLASALSDGLRDMLSTFDEKFGLICLFTAQSLDEWYDAGYTEALSRRIDYDVKISEIGQPAIIELIREHHKLYRKKGARIGGDQLCPFAPEAINKIYQLTPLGRKYPGYIFPNLEALAKKALAEKTKPPISEAFVTSHMSLLPYGSTDAI